MKITALTEDVFGGSPQIDTDKGVIRGVKILGRMSKNKREYTDAALAEAARLYENAQVNVNHPGKRELDNDRPFQDGIGVLENIQIRADGVYGDLGYFKAHPQAPVLVEAAQRYPKRFGLSHHADGEVNRRNGKHVVESIRRVHSVDVVQNPATNQGLFESEEREPMKIKLKEYVQKIDAKHARHAQLVKLMEMDDMAALEVDEAPAGSSADDQAKAAFRSMVMAVVDDDSLDIAAKKTKIGKILGMQEKLADAASEKPSDKGGAAASTDAAAVEESARKTREAHASELLEAAGIKAEPAKVKAIAALTESADRKSLIESWKPTSTTPPADKAKKPLRSEPLFESSRSREITKFPSDHKSFIAAIK